MRTTQGDTWAAKPAGSPSYDIAMLPGARLVTTVETEKNRHLAEGLLKQIIGGDRVSARALFQQPFDFMPQLKLWIATNNKPKISGSDVAIWDRTRLLPFNVRFVDESDAAKGEKVRDRDLGEKLMLESEGILAWMVRGCLDWQRHGLPVSVAIAEASETYRTDQDSVQGFLDECCVSSHGLTCAFAALYSAYEIWCGENDEDAPLSKKALGSNLGERGFPAGKSGSVRLRKRLDLNGKWRTRVEREGADGS
jgi:putative DNA primase/helicase